MPSRSAGPRKPRPEGLISGAGKGDQCPDVDVGRDHVRTGRQLSMPIDPVERIPIEVEVRDRHDSLSPRSAGPVPLPVRTLGG